MFIIDKNLICFLYLYSNSILTGIVINSFSILVAKYLPWSNKWEERFICLLIQCGPVHCGIETMATEWAWLQELSLHPREPRSTNETKANPRYKFQRKFPRNPTYSVAQRSYQKLGPSAQTDQLMGTFHIKTKWDIYIVSHPQMVHGVENLEELGFVKN